MTTEAPSALRGSVKDLEETIEEEKEEMTFDARGSLTTAGLTTQCSRCRLLKGLATIWHQAVHLVITHGGLAKWPRGLDLTLQEFKASFNSQSHQAQSEGFTLMQPRELDTVLSSS